MSLQLFSHVLQILHINRFCCCLIPEAVAEIHALCDLSYSFLQIPEIVFHLLFHLSFPIPGWAISYQSVPKMLHFACPFALHQGIAFAMHRLQFKRSNVVCICLHLCLPNYVALQHKRRWWNWHAFESFTFLQSKIMALNFIEKWNLHARKHFPSVCSWRKCDWYLQTLFKYLEDLGCPMINMYIFYQDLWL